MTSNAVGTKPGHSYEMKYADPFSNIKTGLVEHPAVLSDFFLDSNMNDCHKQAQQHDIGLEKCAHKGCLFQIGYHNYGHKYH